MSTRLLRQYLRLVRAEGPRAAYERARTRLAERRQMSAGRASTSELGGLGMPLLNVLPVSRAPSLGGVQVQLAQRLDAEAGQRPVALLSPEGPLYRLECRADRRALWMSCGPTQASGNPLASAMRQAIDVLRPRAVHFENLATFDASGLSRARPTLHALRAVDGELPLILSVHDFACFCPRPLLIERPQERFCGFSQDEVRCARCLAPDGVDGAEVPALRAETAELWRRAAAVVCPSEFLRERLLALWPGLDAACTHVIAPGAGARSRGRSVRWPPQHIALVGSVRLEKGAGELLPMLPRLQALGLRVSAYGGGDPRWQHRLRLAGVGIHGFYAPGRLPALLERDSVDLALAPSLGPESYGLVLEECWAAGVPVVAYGVGAQGARLRALGGGRVVPLEHGAEGLFAAVSDLRNSLTRPTVPTEWPSPEQAARAHLTLYAALGLL